MNKKELVVKYRTLVSLACGAYNLPTRLLRRIRGKDNRIEAPCALMRRVKIHCSGSGNRIIIGDFSVLKDVSIYISGDNNTVIIGSWCHLNGTEICMEDSGNTVKVVLGFIELALSLKFLSVADLAYGWRILDRETFVALWIAIFGVMGLYLLGMFRFKSDGEPKSSGIGVTRFFLALVSLSFTAYLVPGLWGAPLKATSAFVPPLYTQDFNLYGGEQVEYDDFDEGMKAAAAQGKLVFIDFSGHGCVNCRKMELAVWHDVRVRDIIRKDYVLISLYVDEKTPLSSPTDVEENGATTTLRTVGDKWSYLQRVKFGANAQPFYVPVDAAGNPLNHSYGFDESVDNYIKWLETGLQNSRK